MLPSGRKIRTTEVSFLEKKTHLFRNMQNFLFRSFFQLLKIIFADSASKIEYRQVVKSTLDPKIYQWWHFESRRFHYV
jgi:hypothetical protein